MNSYRRSKVSREIVPETRYTESQTDAFKMQLLLLQRQERSKEFDRMEDCFLAEGKYLEHSLQRPKQLIKIFERL